MAALVLALAVMLGPTAQRRFLFDFFRVADYHGASGLVIANTEAELLVFDLQQRVTLRLPRGAPGLTLTPATRRIFEE